MSVLMFLTTLRDVLDFWLIHCWLIHYLLDTTASVTMIQMCNCIAGDLAFKMINQAATSAVFIHLCDLKDLNRTFMIYYHQRSSVKVWASFKLKIVRIIEMYRNSLQGDV